MDSRMLVIFAIMLLVFWGLSRFSRAQQKKMLAEQERRTNEALVPGNWVRTRAGFYGTVVEVSGDVVTLATPLGDESLWAKSAVIEAEEPPFAAESDDSEDAEAADHEVDDAETGEVTDKADDVDSTVDPTDASDEAGAAEETEEAEKADDADDKASRA